MFRVLSSVLARASGGDRCPRVASLSRPPNRARSIEDESRCIVYTRAYRSSRRTLRGSNGHARYGVPPGILPRRVFTRHSEVGLARTESTSIRRRLGTRTLAFVGPWIARSLARHYVGIKPAISNSVRDDVLLSTLTSSLILFTPMPLYPRDRRSPLERKDPRSEYGREIAVRENRLA